MYEVYERPLCGGYAGTAAKAEPYCRCEDLEAAKAEADCIAEFGLNAFVWDGGACVYDKEACGLD